MVQLRVFLSRTRSLRYSRGSIAANPTSPEPSTLLTR
jgi:hypothetical protein